MSTAILENASPAYDERRDQFVDRILQSVGGLFDVFAIFIGHWLGLYKVLAEGHCVTSEELAARSGIDERYAREWLEQQTVTGVLQVDNEWLSPRQRGYLLPASHAEVLTDTDSLNYLAPLAQLAAGAVSPIDALLEAYRTGSGVPFADYGEDVRVGQAGMNRALCLQTLGKQWLPSIDDIHERLSQPTPARVADFGCGYGYSSIGIALAYPSALVDGYDLDEASIRKARELAREYGVDDRVSFHCRDAGDEALPGDYDLVFALECIHDMGDPVCALDNMRRLAKTDGAILVVDERVGDEFTATGNEVEWMMYGWSILHCLPVGIADGGGCSCAATGTVMRRPVLQRYAEQAGFSRLETLPIDNYFFYVYRLHR